MVSAHAVRVDYLRGHCCAVQIGYVVIMMEPQAAFGDLLRAWRQRRRISQLDLSVEAEISQRHLSFVESGRSVPSRDMVLRLSEHLEVPLRERNQLLTAAGYAAVYPMRPLTDASLVMARAAIDQVIAAHMPHPALAVDRHWTLVTANAALGPLLDGVAATLLEPPVNVLRLSLHPDGLAARIENFTEWRTHVLARLHRQIAVTSDAVLIKLLDELRHYSAPVRAARPPQRDTDMFGGVFVPLRLRVGRETLSFLGTTTVFGTPLEITLSEIAIESFFPADAATAAAMQRLAVSNAGG